MTAVQVVLQQVMSRKKLAKLLIFALFVAASALDARAEFLMCREAESASPWRKTQSAGLLEYLQPAFSGPALSKPSSSKTGATLTVLWNDEPNAFARQHGEIVVTTALLDTLRSSDEEAFVLAHELGHLQSARKPATSALVSGAPTSGNEVAEEEEADRFAYNLLDQKGLDGSAGIPLLVTLQGLSNSPSLPRREAALTALAAKYPHG
jgi:hypothetical protein